MPNISQRAAEFGVAKSDQSLTVSSRLTALGAEAALTDYVIAYDADAAATKKVLVSNIPITWG